jgi:ATP-dependent DNA helicase DinG
MQPIEEFFDKDLRQVMATYVPRSCQVALAECIESVIHRRRVGIFEAGTGTGKTLAYLVPLLRMTGNAIVSTGTRNLQDQLFMKDLPMLLQIFPAKRVAILKGRANYLCPYRLGLNIRMKQVSDEIAARLVEVRSWFSRTHSGDLTELLDPDEDAGFMRLITSSRDNCLGSRCPSYDECPMYRARERALHADIVIVNHHLLFADIAQREEGVQPLLPHTDIVIVDEAHQVPDVARQFYGQSIGSSQLTELCRDFQNELMLLGNDDSGAVAMARRFERAVNTMRDHVLSSVEKDFGRWAQESRSAGLLEEVDLGLVELADMASKISDRSTGLSQCAGRAARFVDQFALLTAHAEDDEYIHWIDRTRQGFVIHLSPTSVSEDLHRLTAQDDRSWIFTSATLAINGDFEHYIDAIGQQGSERAVFESPFDYPQAVVGYLPASLPPPADERHTAMLVEEVKPIIHANRGRTFFLFTSHRALREAAELFQEFNRPVFVQGTSSRMRLLEQFAVSDRSVLLATQSFWEGVDMRGADLKCLIIDKLPFPMPDNPLLKAQSARLESEGRNSFAELSLPKAALSLRQGFGRLIRQEDDQGLFVLGDSRMATRSYRGYLLSSLPEMQWVSHREDAMHWLGTL